MNALIIPGIVLSFVTMASGKNGNSLLEAVCSFATKLTEACPPDNAFWTWECCIDSYGSAYCCFKLTRLTIIILVVLGLCAVVGAVCTCLCKICFPKSKRTASTQVIAIVPTPSMQGYRRFANDLESTASNAFNMQPTNMV